MARRWRNQNAFDPEIRQAHQAFRNVPIPVIKAIIAKESAYKKDAIRGEPHLDDASRGLMQVLLKTARELGFTGTPAELFGPATNLYYGTKLLDQLIAKLGNWERVFSAYNGGDRPNIGFGTKATRIIRRVCLARNSQGRCTKRVNVPVGEFANQEYVDKVKEYVQYFGSDRASTEGGEVAGGVATTVTVAGIGGIGLLLLYLASKGG